MGVGKTVTLDDGTFLYSDYGTYGSGLTLLFSKEWKEVKVGAVEGSFRVLPLDLFNIRFDADRELGLQTVEGDFFISRKGTKCFRAKEDGKHIFLRVNWGGAFSDSRGDTPESLGIEKDVLYFHKAKSHGKRLGVDYYIFPKGYQRVIKQEDI
jgi:hypothetical protein